MATEGGKQEAEHRKFSLGQGTFCDRDLPGSQTLRDQLIKEG